jgi:hypothetical protein
MEYLRKDHARPLVLGAENDGLLMWYVDASFAEHPNMRGRPHRQRLDNGEKISHYSFNKAKVEYKELN